MNEFNIGDMVRVIKDDEIYTYCIGLYGEIVDKTSTNTRVVKFKNMLPPAPHSNKTSSTRVFFISELELVRKEHNVLKLLNKIDNG